MNKFGSLFSKFGRKHILVVGDLILDQYIQGSVSRISPEAPVPIVLERESFTTPGGAANVAHNLKGLGAKVTLVGRIGNDGEGKVLLKQLKQGQVDTGGIFIDPKIPTICKTRVIAQHQQVVRIDREDTTSKGSPSVQKQVNSFISKNIGNYDAIIISDYGKGLVTAELVDLLRNKALELNKILTIDPKVEHFGYYRDVTAITPNLNEAENAIRNIKITSSTGSKLKINKDRLLNDQDINRAGLELLRYLNLNALLITLGEKGMRLFEKGKTPVSIETQAREVYDVSGAGDAVISAFTLSLAAGASKKQAAQIANYAAGIVVAKIGAAAVNKKELQNAING